MQNNPVSGDPALTVLGIETSCDETAVAVYNATRGLLAHQVFSQVAIHAQYGGVVPELASRDHIRKLLPLLEAALTDAGVNPHDLSGVAYTAGPGLIGALLVGATMGVGLGLAWGIPTVAVHHMEAHLLAPLLEADGPDFPFVALLVSGGHTMLVDVSGFGCYRLLGETRDDAAGEAFDKTAKLLGLSYPGGPQLAVLAEPGNGDRFAFPRPMLKQRGLDFSFSGLKTAVMLRVRALEEAGSLTDSERADLADGFQEAVVDTLVAKSLRAIESTGYHKLVVAGGVGANQRLRARLREELAQHGAKVYYPRTEFCTDNGAMVAFAGLLHIQAGAISGLEIQARPRWDLQDI